MKLFGLGGKKGKEFRVAILGAGNIARAMAEAVNGLGEEATLYGVASRSLEKAKAFAKTYGVKKAYGSYEELAKDDRVDLIYIATPHSEHYQNAKLCIENGRNCLVEKAFCGNLTQTRELIRLAKEKRVLLAEAMWTRYQPSKDIIREVLESGMIGTPQSLIADFSISARGIERLEKPELAGGALLDLGIYSLTVPAMYFGTEIKGLSVGIKKNEYGVDMEDEILMEYKDGKTARVLTGFGGADSNYAKITGDAGSIVFGPINVPRTLERLDAEGNCISKEELPIRINGYEYQVLECKEAILRGETETKSMPLSETIRMMGWMDSIRDYADVAYPFEEKKDRSHPDLEVWGVEKAFKE